MRLRTQKQPQVKRTLQGAKRGCKDQNILTVDIVLIFLSSWKPFFARIKNMEIPIVKIIVHMFKTLFFKTMASY